MAEGDPRTQADAGAVLRAEAERQQRSAQVERATLADSQAAERQGARLDVASKLHALAAKQKRERLALGKKLYEGASGLAARAQTAGSGEQPPPMVSPATQRTDGQVQASDPFAPGDAVMARAGQSAGTAPAGGDPLAVTTRREDVFFGPKRTITTTDPARAAQARAYIGAQRAQEQSLRLQNHRSNLQLYADPQIASAHSANDDAYMSGNISGADWLARNREIGGETFAQREEVEQRKLNAVKADRERAAAQRDRAATENLNTQTTQGRLQALEFFRAAVGAGGGMGAPGSLNQLSGFGTNNPREARLTNAELKENYRQFAGEDVNLSDMAGAIRIAAQESIRHQGWFMLPAQNGFFFGTEGPGKVVDFRKFYGLLMKADRVEGDERALVLGEIDKLTGLRRTIVVNDDGDLAPNERLGEAARNVLVEAMSAGVSVQHNLNTMDSMIEVLRSGPRPLLTAEDAQRFRDRALARQPGEDPPPTTDELEPPTEPEQPAGPPPTTRELGQQFRQEAETVIGPLLGGLVRAGMDPGGALGRALGRQLEEPARVAGEFGAGVLEPEIRAGRELLEAGAERYRAGRAESEAEAERQATARGEAAQQIRDAYQRARERYVVPGPPRPESELRRRLDRLLFPGVGE